MRDLVPLTPANSPGDGRLRIFDQPGIDGRAERGIIPQQLDGHRVAELQELLEDMSAEEAIGWVLDRFGRRAMIATSFQRTGSVIVDIATRVDPKARFFYVDTDVLFKETYETRDALEKRYGITFERYAGISLEEQAEKHGANLWARQPDACCGIRKVEPMKEALTGARCWVAGVRRSDSQTRSKTPKFAWDRRFGLWKLNPLADWSDDQIWNHIRENDVPYNELHDQGFPSIGCTHCTRPVTGGEEDRAGRWADFDKTECGING
jgi:phosphoadenosine phosphosulfate reductase